MSLTVGDAGSVIPTYHPRSHKRQRTLVRVLVYLLLITMSVLIIFPFIWMLLTALKPNWMVYLVPVRWFPHPPRWSNFVRVFHDMPFLLYAKNTAAIVFWNLFGNLFSSTLVAYGFARLRAPGKNLLFLVMLATMMLPPAVTLIPIFYLFKELGWINSFYPLTVPAFLGNAFFIFLLRQFFMTLPLELEEAAKIDGANYLVILLRIFVPMAQPALATVAVFTFVGTWNDFFGPLIYLNSDNTYTMALGLTTFVQKQYVQWNDLMAASIYMMLPCLVLFFFAQRYFVEGITLTGVKE